MTTSPLTAGQIDKLATVNAIQRAAIYDALGLDVFQRQEAEDEVRRLIARNVRSAARRRTMLVR